MSASYFATDENTCTGELQLGWLVGLTEEGVPLVEYAAGDGEPQRALSLVQVTPSTLEASMHRAVLLGRMAHGSQVTPVIVGFVNNQLVKTESAVVENTPGTREVRVDGRKVLLEGKQEVVLRCGESSITLRADGKIVLRGTQIISRASEVNRIKGGSVQIN